MDLGHLLTRSGLTYPEVSSNVCHDSFYQLENSVSLPWVIIIWGSDTQYYSLSYLTVILTFLWYTLFSQTRKWRPIHSGITVSSGMEEMPSLNMPVQRQKVAFLPLDLPCSGPVTHSGEILTTGKSHGKKPHRSSLNICTYTTIQGPHTHNTQYLTLNIPSLALQRCLPSWGPRRTPCFFFAISQLFDAADYSNYVFGVSETIIQWFKHC